jgi:hypothetical protein
MVPSVVNICHRPSGVASFTRSPFGARPRKRVICVVTPLSSRNFSFSGGMDVMAARNSSRRWRLISVSRSAAWRDFFKPQAHPPQQAPYETSGSLNTDPRQLLAQFRLGQVRLCTHPVAHLLLNLGRHAADRTMPLLRPTTQLAAAHLLHTDLLAVSPTDAKLSRQGAKAPRSCRIGFQNPTAQIVRYGLCHPVRFAEIASSNLSLRACSGI